VDLSTGAVLAAVGFGSVRAFELWRASCKVDVVNVAVLGTLAHDRGGELSNVLKRAGSGLYLEVARAIAEPTDKLRIENEAELKGRLERDALRAVSTAHGRLKRHAWLDALTIVLVGLSGVSALVGPPPSAGSALGLIAATLLWWSNARGSRSIATQIFSGAMALVDSLVAVSQRDMIAIATRSSE
jgi:hypothetical protein